MRTIIIQLILFPLLLLSASAVFGQTIEVKKLQKLASSYLKIYGASEHVSAVSVTLYSPELKKPLSVYAGSIDTKNTQPVTANSLFQIGSIAKSFIAALVVKLENDPKTHLFLDDPIDRYFPEYKNWHDVTIKDLLNMTSGIPDYLNDPTVLAEYALNPYKDYDASEWISRMYNHPLLFTPGTHFNYSNTNYLLLARLIEKLSGHTVGEEIDSNFVKPLKLNNTFYVDHLPNSKIIHRLVHGYQFEEKYAYYLPLGTDVTDFSMSYMQAAGGVISNSRDMAKWIMALLTPGKVLTAAELKELTTIYDTNGVPVSELSVKNPNGYGLGLSMQYSAMLNSTIYLYEGVTLGYRAIYVYAPKVNVLIAVTVNSSFVGKENHLLGFTNEVSKLVL